MSPDAQKLKEAVDNGLELVDLLERLKIEVPPPIKLILKAMKEGTEIGMSADEAANHFAAFLKSMDTLCRLQEKTTGEDAYVCLARRETTNGSLSYAGPLNAVLNPDNPFSVVSIYWRRKARSGWACVWDEIRNGSPSGLYRKCFTSEDSSWHLPKAAPGS